MAIGQAVKVSEGTKQAVIKAFKLRFEAARRVSGKKASDFSSSAADPALLEAAGLPQGMSWDAVRNQLKRLRSTTDDTSKLKLIDALITDDQISFDDAIVDEQAVDNFHVHCPSFLTDYRVLIVGQLPNERLFPAVFVSPNDREHLWFPQRAKKEHTAFACNAQFGNRDGLAQVDPLPLRFSLRVYALDKPWWTDQQKQRPSAPLTSNELELQIKKYKPFAQIDRDVHRVDSGVGRVTLIPGGHDPIVPAREIACQKQVTIEWEGRGNCYIEVRSSEHDVLVTVGQAYASGVTLTLDTPAHVSRSNIIHLPKEGLYRVSLYHVKYQMAGPAYEWWVDLRRPSAVDSDIEPESAVRGPVAQKLAPSPR